MRVKQLTGKLHENKLELVPKPLTSEIMKKQKRSDDIIKALQKQLEMQRMYEKRYAPGKSNLVFL